MIDRVDIPGSGYIQLMDKLGSDITVANAARISFWKEVSEFSDSEEKLIDFLGRNSHFSPFRHVFFQFRVECPEFVARQFYKHQVGMSYTSGETGFPDLPFNEISGRYVELQEKFWTPKEFRGQGKSNRQVGNEPLGTYAQDVSRETYDKAIADSYRAYKSLLKIGVCREQARAVLPVGFITSFITTCSLQACFNFIKLRTHEGAQEEIREYAVAMDSIIQQYCPISLSKLHKYERK